MEYLSFKLPDDFVEQYRGRAVPWGFPIGGGNSLGELTFLTKYSRRKEDGTKERWWETCKRVIEGMFSIQKDWCNSNRLPWNERKSQNTAQDAFERLFVGKWTPPGRGLWLMGTEFVHKAQNSAALQNCAFVSTDKVSNHSAREAVVPFTRLMEMSMLGIGVGFDTKGAGKLQLHEPLQETDLYKIPDTREGWYESVGKQLESFFFASRPSLEFDYSEIRAAGEPIKGFGGVAAGPGPLIALHVKLDQILGNREGEYITSTDIVDIMNLIGKCVVAGNVRRSAEIVLGSADDKEFLNLKNYEVNPERMGPDGWGFTSNNSVYAEVGGNYDHLVEGIANNGEPGLIYMDLCREYGRLIDPSNNKDYRAAGTNPCASADTLLLTKEYGLKKIGELAATGETFHVWNGDKEWMPSHAWSTGVKPVLKAEITDGRSIELTGNHVVEVRRTFGDKNRYSEMVEVEAQNLLGERIMPFLGDGSWEGAADIDPDTALFYGLIQGDGNVGDPQSKQGVRFVVNEPEFIDFVKEYANVHDLVVTEHASGDLYVSGDTLYKEMKAFGFCFSTLPERVLPTKIFTQNPLIVKNFLRGLYSANGCAQGKYNRISLKTTCKAQAEEVQVLLSALGLSAYITTNAPTEIQWSNGLYLSKESYDVNIGSAWGFNLFQESIGFLHDHKSVQTTHTVGFESGNVKSSIVKSVEYVGDFEVFDFTEPDTHWGWANGIKIHNCGEQTLESMELCVTGDTLVQTSSGIARIEELEGTNVDIWNGEEWSTVSPFSTGVSSVYRVTLSDGSYLDATPGHEWLARRKTERTFKELTTSQLEVGMYLPEFGLAVFNDGKMVDHAYELGWFAGDGYLDTGIPMGLVQESEYEILNYMTTTSVRKEQIALQARPFKRVSFHGLFNIDTARQLRDHTKGLPSEVLAMDSHSIAEFMGGWIDTDGSVIRQENTHHYILYGDEQKLRDAQILLRRVGVNHSTIRQFAAKGSVTNKGTRNQDLWRLSIPSYEAHAIHTKLKVATKLGSRFGVNHAHPASQIDYARKQKIVSVELMPTEKETYCFNEPKLHRGVFANVLTKQCTLTETFPIKHETFEDYKKTIKVAYLYAKSVTLLPTHWAETNSIMQRNRRIGCSVSGVAQFAERYGWKDLRTWLNKGYEEVQRYDEIYSDWLGVRESIKTTSVKPSGTVSLLFGVTPGVHWPVADVYIRRMRLAVNDPLLDKVREAGYHTEPDVMDPTHSVVVELPTRGPQVRTEREVSMWEKANLAVLAQRYWADNQVSVTITFQDHEKDQIGALLRTLDGQLKSISMLPLLEVGGAYKQMPYERITEEEWEKQVSTVSPIKWDNLYNGEALDAEGEKFCSNDTCQI